MATAATQRLLPQHPGRGQRLVTDNGYRSVFAAHLRAPGLRDEMPSRPPAVHNFVPVAKRWVVEFTLPGWPAFGDWPSTTNSPLPAIKRGC